MSALHPVIAAEAKNIAAAAHPNKRDARDVHAQAAASVTLPPSKLAVKKQERLTKKSLVSSLTAKHDLQFTYIRRRNYGEGWPFLGDIVPNGGITIAYRVPVNGGKVVEVATAVCNKKDTFDKVEGKYLAAKNFDEGKTVRMVVPSGSHYGQYLQSTFEA